MADTRMKLSKRTGLGFKTNKTLMFTKRFPVKKASLLRFLLGKICSEYPCVIPESDLWGEFCSTESLKTTRDFHLPMKK